MPLPIETKQLVLRTLEEKDLLDIVGYSSSSDFRLVRNLEWQPDDEESARQYWANQQAIEPKDDPQ